MAQPFSPSSAPPYVRRARAARRRDFFGNLGAALVLAGLMLGAVLAVRWLLGG